MTSKVIKRLVRRAEPANPNELKKVLVTYVAGEWQAYTRGYSKSTNLNGFTTIYEGCNRKNQAIDESEPMEVNAVTKPGNA